MEDQQLFLRKLNRRTRFTQFLVWIALFFTAVGIAAGYKNWLRIHEKAKTGLRGMAEIKKELPNFAQKKRLQQIEETLNKRLSSNSAQFDKTIKELNVMQKSTEHLAETVYQQVENITKVQTSVVGRLPSVLHKDWSLSELHFLLQTAVQVLALKQDKHAAITALKLADNMLQKKGLESLLPLRKQISQDIARLHQYQAPQLSVLSEKISEMQARLESEQLQKKRTEEIKEASKSEEGTDKKANINQKDDSILADFKEMLSKAIVVRKYDQPMHHEMDDEARESLFQLLSLKLESLRMMLLLKQDKNFHSQIIRLKSLLKKYNYVSLMSDLNELDDVNLSSEIPDISGTLILFESLLANKNGKKKK